MYKVILKSDYEANKSCSTPFDRYSDAVSECKHIAAIKGATLLITDHYIEEYYGVIKIYNKEYKNG